MTLGVPEWMSRSGDKQAAATSILRNAQLARETWELCGKSVEFALKAYIMRVERLNIWPDARSRPDLHIHNPRQLILKAGIDISLMPPKQAAAFMKVCEWRREHDYEAHSFPHQEAKDIYKAAFGTDGVLDWIKERI